jgi:CRP-like cAMP-binding protein
MLRLTEPQASAAIGENGDPLTRWDTLLRGISKGKVVVKCEKSDTIFMQGLPADSLYFLLQGKIELAVTSQDGKEAIVATVSAGEFFGEGCLAGQPLRTGTAVSAGESTLVRVEKATMARMLRDDPALSELFIAHLLSRIVRYEADFVDQIFNSAEKRLARILLLLSRFGKESRTEVVASGITQEHLAQMVGTTRSRVNYFMNKFRKLGFIEYNAKAGTTVHRGLLTVVREQN